MFANVGAGAREREGARPTARFRLDEPIYVQYVAWLSRVLVGDFGISFFTNRPVAEELFGALGNTLVLALPLRRLFDVHLHPCANVLRL